jgi:hypothetical protein
LFDNFTVLLNLLFDDAGMGDQRILLHREFLTFLLFRELLSLHHTQEFIAFSFGLGSKSVFLILELLSAGSLEFLNNTLALLFGITFFSSVVALVLLEGTLGT